MKPELEPEYFIGMLQELQERKDNGESVIVTFSGETETIELEPQDGYRFFEAGDINITLNITIKKPE